MLVFYNADATCDSYYGRFVSGPKKNLIIGTSRAAQGINPALFQSEKEYYNFSFTSSLSPFGEVYFKAIVAKLDSADEKQDFILTIDPWALAEDSSKSSVLRESGNKLNKVEIDKWYTPIEYFLSAYDYSLIQIFETNENESLHENGWLEISVPMDSISVAIRTSKKLTSYSKNDSEKLSEYRFNSLKTLVEYLSRFGQVHFFRLPVSSEMRKLEEKVFPSFDSKIQNTLNSIDLSYELIDLQYLESDIQFTDGNHVAKSSVPFVVREIEKYLEEI